MSPYISAKVVVLEGHLRQRREELRTYALERGAATF